MKNSKKIGDNNSKHCYTPYEIFYMIYANYYWKFLSFLYDFRYVGKRYSDEANSPELELESYNISDITLRYKQAFDQWQPVITFQIRNLFNESYQIVGSYPIPGREFRLSVGLAYH